ncbi:MULTISPECIES: chitin-binding domain-containing protein [Chryseobacterium]|uniref:Chitin-binding type-2 domain-containing protein n=1 Tax=Chryseobacterium geocarposphaerae TaxID=1416776 RepID=A0ABU1LB62_9FLAO|nr:MULTISPECIES: chitin-binding domain-containing protein [Chryseobacterium]MDR6403962.1 hypothetical protein [Chryseobacterium geocarposphaerae]MDR6698519.1 hypothetical protein [Chryseobacterium ginsenosidimutans]
MKNKIILLWAFLFSGLAFAQIGVNSPDPKTTLDVNAKNPTGATTATDGILIPRVDRQRAQNMVNIPLSTLIYVNNISTGTQTGITVNVDELGFYYFDGKEWVKLRDPYNIGPIETDWKLLGNANTDPSTNFLGTTDNQGVAIRTNNTIRAIIENTGILRVGNITNASVNQSTANIANASTADANVQPGVLSVLDSRLSTALIENPPTADIFNPRGGPASDLLTIGHNTNSQGGNYTPRSVAFYNVNATNTGGIGQVAWIATPGKATRLSETAASISDYTRDKTNNYVGLSFSTRGATGFGSRMVVNPIGFVGIGTTTPTSLLDLGATFGSTSTENVGKKLAVYNNTAGTDFYGLGISSGLLQFHAASTPDEAPGMVLTGNGNVGIGTTAPASNVILDLSANNKAFLPPRLTTAQRDAINPKQAGMMIYNVTNNCLEFWNSLSWVSTCAVVPPAPGTISTLNCATATHSGTLIANAAASGVSSSITYAGGNGGSHGGQIVNSTGITGLTATLAAGSFVSGAGTLVYNITGTPSGPGTAVFAINIGGQACNLSRTVGLPAAVVASLSCATAAHNGTLTAGTATSGVSSSIPYTGGNGGTYTAQTVNSTGVSGLTATLTAGTLATGNGNLTYTITGSPNSAGTASFAISLGGQSCTFTRTVTAPIGGATINCGGATLNGTLKNSNAASGVTISVPYTGGNGGSYSAQSIPSTGVTGLTATLSAGNFNVGSGTLTFTVTGTPQGEGTASFTINMGGSNCTANVTVNELQPSDINCTGPDGIYPYPNSNTKYVRCITISGVKYAYIYTCPAGSQFNPTTKLCVAVP